MSLSCLVLTFGGRTRYLQSGLEPRHILPGTTGTVWCFLYTEPNGAVWDPTESSAQLTSAPTWPPGSSSAGPTPRPHWPCYLQTGQHRHTQKELWELCQLWGEAKDKELRTLTIFCGQIPTIWAKGQNGDADLGIGSVWVWFDHRKLDGQWGYLVWSSTQHKRSV